MKNQVQIEKSKLELEIKFEDVTKKLNDDDFSFCHDSCKKSIEEINIMLSGIKKLETGGMLSDEEISAISELTGKYRYQATYILIEAGAIK